MEPLTDKDFVDPTETSDENKSQDQNEKVTKFTKWKNEPTLEDLKNDLTQVTSTHDAHVSQVKEWLDNLYVTGKAKPKNEPGRSRVQPKLIRKQAEWRYAALSEPFLSQDDIFTADPVTHEDKQAAEQNELVLNTQFRRDIDRTSFVDQYVRTAVNEGTVICRTGWEYQESIEEVEVPVYGYRADPSQAQMMEDLAAMSQANPEEFEKVPDHFKEALGRSLEAGQVIVPYVIGTKTEEQVKVLMNRPTIEVCDFEDVMIDPTCQGNIDNANFVIYRFETSIALLQKDGGYVNLDYISGGQTESIIAQSDENMTEKDLDAFTFRDKPRKKFYAYEEWVFWDIHGTGELVPILVTWVNDCIIKMTENPFPDQKIPFVYVAYLPIKRSVYGEPDGVLIEDNQKIAGAVSRGMIDSMARSANGQKGMRKDMLDPINRRKYMQGLDYEFNPVTDPRQGVVEHTYPEIPASAQYMLQLQNVEAESLTGVKAYSGGLSGDALGDVATSVRGVLDAASKRELGILRRLANGITEIGRKIISMNSEFLEEEEIVRITNDTFVPVQRDDLAGEIDLKLSITTAEEDNEKARELAFMLQTNAASADPEETRMIRAEIARLRKMPDLAKRIEEFQPQPTPHQQRMEELEFQIKLAELENIKSETAENYAGANADNAKAQNTASDTDKKNLDYVEQESGTTQEREVQKITSQAEAQTRKSIIEKAIDNDGQGEFDPAA